jgi:hypothetical protein
MTTIVGGLRARLIRESLFQMIEEALTDLGWFASTRPHLPLTFRSGQVDQNTQIALNTAALWDENTADEDAELGSNLTEERGVYYIDFYAESDPLGRHFISDVKDILRGKFTSIDRDDPSFDVYDYTQATPPVITRCQIEEVETGHAHGFSHPWMAHWYSCQFVVVDTYGDEES